MRGVATMMVAAAFGAVAYYGISQWFGGDPSKEQDVDGSAVGGSAEGSVPAAGEGTIAAGRETVEDPVLSARSPGLSEQGTRTPPMEGAGSAKAALSEPSDDPPRTAPEAELVGRALPGPKFFQGSSQEPATRSDQVVPEVPEAGLLEPLVPDSGPDPKLLEGIERDLQQARAKFAAGREQDGILLVKQIYAVAKELSEVDLVPEVARLLRQEVDPTKRREYTQYLARRDTTGRMFEGQMLACRKALATADSSPEAAAGAWDSLTLAYWLAGARQRKDQVLALLDPFIDSMVFSGNYSNLLKTYNIQPGDSLSSIAARFKTTADSIRRINNLSTDVIQPRQRVRVLSGEAEIFVQKADFSLCLTVDGRVVREFRVGLGIGDATPEGEFVIDVRQKDPTWFRQGQPALPAGHPDNVLGTRWLGFKETDAQAGIGIHGTNDPSDLGTRSSGGCVRMRKDDVELLYDFVGYGTPVTVRS